MPVVAAHPVDESLADFRRAVRAPIHNVISYAEMISDVTGADQNPGLGARVAEVIRISQNVLGDIGAPLANEQDATASLKHLQQRLQTHASNLTAAIEGARQLICGTDSAAVHCDADKLLQAAETFRKQLDAMDVGRLSSALSSGGQSVASEHLLGSSQT